MFRYPQLPARTVGKKDESRRPRLHRRRECRLRHNGGERPMSAASSPLLRAGGQSFLEAPVGPAARLGGPAACLLALVASAVLPAAAGADSALNVRERLRAAGISPPPLFPTTLPARVAASDASLSINGRYFDATFVTESPSAGRRSVSFTRRSPGAVGAQLRDARRKRLPVRTVRLRGRRVYFAEQIASCYFWREQGLSYFVCGQGAGTRTSELRAMVSSARPLR